MLQLFWFFFVIFIAIMIFAIFVAAGIFIFQVTIRWWQNKLTPWINKHLGEPDWGDF